MPFPLRAILLALAFVFFGLAAIGVSSPRLGLQPAGLALLALAFLLG